MSNGAASTSRRMFQGRFRDAGPRSGRFYHAGAFCPRGGCRGWFRICPGLGERLRLDGRFRPFQRLPPVMWAASVQFRLMRGLSAAGVLDSQGIQRVRPGVFNSCLSRAKCLMPFLFPFCRRIGPPPVQ